MLPGFICVGKLPARYVIVFNLMLYIVIEGVPYLFLLQMPKGKKTEHIYSYTHESANCVLIPYSNIVISRLDYMVLKVLLLTI